MKLSVFVAVLLPGLSAFVVPNTFVASRGAKPLSVRPLLGNNAKAAVSSKETATLVEMTTSNSEDGGAWDMSQFFKGIMGTASSAKAKADTTASEVYAEMKKKVLVKHERQGLEGQLCSLLRIAGDAMSPKSEACVRRLARELEALQPNANAFGLDRVSLAGSWKLLYATVRDDGRTERSAEKLSAVERISYVSENYRISHTDCGVLKVYKRVAIKKPKTMATSIASGAIKSREDDTAMGSLVGASGAGLRKSPSKQALVKGPAGVAKQPLRKRMFFGWRRR